jgi:hypothetical protein
LKYLFLSLIVFLTSCSLNKESAYWNEDPIKKSADDKKLSKILEKTGDYKSMTFDEFNLFLKNYSNNAEYPNIIDEPFKDNASKALKVKTEGSKNRINKMLSGKTKQYPKGIKN